MMAVIKERYDYLINITLPEGVTPVSGAELVNKVSEGEETTYTLQVNALVFIPVFQF